MDSVSAERASVPGDLLLTETVHSIGLPYSIHDNHLVFTVTSKKSQKNKEFVENL